MGTDKQIEANRRNAQLCTGPNTEEGKARSSQNALKTGIYSKAEVLVTESREALDELIADFHNRFAPATPEEQSLVDALIRYEWLSRRYMAADTAVWNGSLQEEIPNVGRAFVWHSETLARAGRYFNAARKGFSATLKELRALQAERKSEEAERKSELAVEPVRPIELPKPTLNQQVERKLVSFRQLPESPTEAGPSTAPIEQKTEDPPMAA